MPEGPEVHRMVVTMNRAFHNSLIRSIIILSGKYMSKKPYGYESMIRQLPMKIKSINNKGKFIWIDTDTDWTIWITLGLTGELSTSNSTNTRIKFNTTKGVLYINDPLSFGTIHFMSKRDDLARKLRSLGPDPLQEQVTLEAFTTKLDKMNPNLIIADALLDQSLLSGVGNYIRAEALYDSQISPFIPIKSLDEDARRRLLASIKKIVKTFYKYPDTEFKVYRKRTTPDGREVITSKTANDRTIHYV